VDGLLLEDTEMVVPAWFTVNVTPPIVSVPVREAP
jgi:hypothetical protein